MEKNNSGILYDNVYILCMYYTTCIDTISIHTGMSILTHTHTLTFAEPNKLFLTNEGDARLGMYLS